MMLSLLQSMPQTSMCLHHFTALGANGVEHEPPRRFPNEMTEVEIEEQTDLIHDMYRSKSGTREIHKNLETTTKRLGEKGKQKVSG